MLQVFKWKKTNLTLRLKHEKDLRQKLSARMDRRECIRASSLFSSEVCLNRMRSTIECTLEITQLRIGCHDTFDVAIYDKYEG